MSAARIPILRILAHAMDMVKVFVKLNSEQEAAWQIVRAIADDPKTD